MRPGSEPRCDSRQVIRARNSSASGACGSSHTRRQVVLVAVVQPERDRELLDDVSRGLRRLPVSMPRIVLTETPDRSASASWVRPARSRNRRITVAN
jgi:hypothetical protein